MLGLGLVLAIAMAFTPFVAALVLGVALCIVLASILAGGVRGSFRALGVAVGGVAVAFVLNVPWALGVARPGADWSGFAGIAPAGPGTLSLGQILRFETGSIGAAPLGWAFLVVGGLALVIGRGWRLGMGSAGVDDRGGAFRADMGRGARAGSMSVCPRPTRCSRRPRSASPSRPVWASRPSRSTCAATGSDGASSHRSSPPRHSRSVWSQR